MNLPFFVEKYPILSKNQSIHFKSVPSSFIDGPDYIGTTGTFSWEPAIFCGCAPFNTQWVINFNNGVVQYQTTAGDAPIFIDFQAGGIISSTGLVTISMGVVDCNGNFAGSSKNVTVDIWGVGLRTPSGSEKLNNSIVSKTADTFGEISPNLSSSTATFEYNLLEATPLKVLIVDGLGKVVKTLINENKKAGYYQDKIDVSALNSGIYYLNVTSNKQSLTKKLIVQH